MGITHKVSLDISLLFKCNFVLRYPFNLKISILFLVGVAKERKRMFSTIAKSRVHGFCLVNSNNEVQNVQTKLELALGHDQYSILTSLVYLENTYCIRFSNILNLLQLLTIAAKCNTILSQ